MWPTYVYKTSSFGPGQMMVMSSGYTGTHTVASVERQDVNQKFYQGCCEFYAGIDESWYKKILRDHFDEGSVVDYKLLYERLKEEF